MCTKFYRNWFSCHGVIGLNTYIQTIFLRLCTTHDEKSSFKALHTVSGKKVCLYNLKIQIFAFMPNINRSLEDFRKLGLVDEVAGHLLSKIITNTPANSSAPRYFFHTNFKILLRSHECCQLGIGFPCGEFHKFLF